MLSAAPLTRDLVLVGGGHAHALVLRSWGMDPLPGVRLTLINPGPTAPYTGMLPGHIAGHYDRDTLEIDLVRLCRHAGARLILGKASGIDRANRVIEVAGRGRVAYDVTSFDVGITGEMDLPGFAEHGIGAKPLDRYAARWRAFHAAVMQGKTAPQIAVIGGGVAGCELAMAMAHALRDAPQRAQITVLEAGPTLSGLGPMARRKVQAAMRAQNISWHCNAPVARVAAEAVTLQSGETIAATLCVAAAGAFPHDWIARTGLPLRDGFIEVGPDLATPDDPAVFAVGDCAAMPFAPRPKAGVFAVRAAPVLHRNLRAALGSGEAPRRFRPQRNYLKLVSLGDRSAMAEKYGLALAHPLLWRWKDRIDRAFMDRLADLPVMQAPTPRGAVAAGVAEHRAGAPLCGGCGAKVAGGVLGETLTDLPPARDDVLAGAGDDAAILRRPGGGYQVLSTDHLRGFIADPHLMARIAAIHALGDVWSMGAAPQVVLSQVILPEMSPALQGRTLAEITAATQEVMAEAGAQLVGGHTTMGAELTLGFTVTGTCDSPPLTQAGARAGDVAILTRPIGSGVLLAAEMAGRAVGRDVTAALDIMATPQHREAQILRKTARAMTDVTGFGLAGHLGAMAKMAGLGAHIDGAAVPIYAGAEALSEAGVASSLMPANREDTPVDGAPMPLLHDPQTAGGLLAAVPPEHVDSTLAALKAAGCAGHVVGVFETGQGLRLS